MGTIFKNPHLPDYFHEVPDVTAASSPEGIPSIVAPYEAGKVITFPNLKLDIDFDFWESVPTDAYPDLKKFSSFASVDPGAPDALLDKHMARAALPSELEAKLRPQIKKFYAGILPIYERLFAGYKFKQRRVTWRLNLIHNEDMHVDTYADEYPDHFARMFVNLDRQPRIWQTSWTIDDMIRLYGDRVSRSKLETCSRAQAWKEIKNAVYGPTTQWWDDEPRHVAYFDPGEAWIVDSRQVAHQIFYGRRAVSIDFWVDQSSMQNPDRHYLNITDAFRQSVISAEAA